MLERINDMPEGTIGLAAKGAVTAADCEQMLLPMVAGRPNSSERTGVLLLFGPEFDDFEADPVDGYAQFAFHRWHEFGRLALASDVDWLCKAVTLLAPFMRGEVLPRLRGRAGQDLDRLQPPPFRSRQCSAEPMAMTRRLDHSLLEDFWRLVMLEGTGLVVIGVAAVILPQLATLAIDLLVGWLLFIAGLFRFASMFSAQGAPGYWSSMVLAALTALLGALLALWPTAGILTLTMVLTLYLVAHGVGSLAIAGALRGATDLWFWIALGALADFLLAGLVIAGWPSTAAWAMGLYVGINLTVSGLMLILAAAGAHATNG